MPTTYKIATVSNGPEQAKALLLRVASDLSDKFDLEYVGNADNVEEVEKFITEHKPDVFVTATNWTEEQARQAVANAKSINPHIKALILPYGLHHEKGPDAVVEYIEEHLPGILG